jgi:hypothetical protein
MTDTFVYPSEVFAAIREAKRKTPSDKFGDGAFEVDTKGQVRIGKNNTRYMGFNILKYNPKIKQWGFIPLVMKFANLTTTANIYPPGDKKKKYAGARLQFTMKKTSFQRKINGKDTVNEEYGKAKLAIYRAFNRIITRLLSEKKIYNSKTNIASSIQTERIVDQMSQQKAKLESGEEIIRVDIPFAKVNEGESSKISSTEEPQCKIFDLTRREPAPEEGDIPFKKGTFLDGEKKEVKITYGNIHNYIKYGSACSGLDRMDSVCFSSQGISLPSKTEMLAVKRSFGRAPAANTVFNASEFDDMINAETQEEPEAPKEENESENIDELPVASSDASIEAVVGALNDSAFDVEPEPEPELEVDPDQEDEIDD